MNTGTDVDRGKGDVTKEKTVNYKPRREGENTFFPQHSVWDFQPLELGDSTLLLPRPPSLWYFAMAALAD